MQEPLILTARLAVRRWLATDVDTIYTVCSDPEVALWVDDGQPISFAAALKAGRPQRIAAQKPSTIVCLNPC